MARKKTAQKAESKVSLWNGPFVDGITASWLARFLVCRERFRLRVVEGLRYVEEFDHAIEYGSMFHEAIEVYLLTKKVEKALSKIKEYSLGLRKRYTSSTDEISFWTKLCLAQFKSYIRFLQQNHDSSRKELLQEDVFRVPYYLSPDIFPIILRGKYDSVHSIANRTRKSHNLYLEENKTKKYISERNIGETLHGNLQSMFYIICLSESIKGDVITNLPQKPEGVKLPAQSKLAGISYRVIRRPLEEKMPIRQRKSENQDDFIKRVALRFDEEPEYYFYKMHCTLSKKEIDDYRTQILEPILWSVIKWWDWIEVDPFDPWSIKGTRRPSDKGIHFKMPWGVYNSLSGGYNGDFYELLTKGSDVGLIKTTELFPELQCPL